MYMGNRTLKGSVTE